MAKRRRGEKVSMPDHRHYREGVGFDRWGREPATESQLERLEQLAGFEEIGQKEREVILDMAAKARAALGTPKAMTKLRAFDLICEIGGKIADRRGGIQAPRPKTDPRAIQIAPAVDDPQSHRRDLFDVDPAH